MALGKWNDMGGLTVFSHQSREHAILITSFDSVSHGPIPAFVRKMAGVAVGGGSLESHVDCGLGNIMFHICCERFGPPTTSLMS
jgi:hypothetical protein